MKSFKEYCEEREVNESWVDDAFRKVKNSIGGMFGKKPEDPDYLAKNNLLFTNKNADEWKKTLESIKNLFPYPGMPQIEKMPVDKRDVAFRTWLHRTPEFNDKDKMAQAANLSKKLLVLSKGMGFDQAIPNAEVMYNAFQQRLTDLDKPVNSPKLLDTERTTRYPEPLDPKEYDPKTFKDLNSARKELFILKTMRNGEDQDFIVNGLAKFGLDPRAARAAITKVMNRENQRVTDDMGSSRIDSAQNIQRNKGFNPNRKHV